MRFGRSRSSNVTDLGTKRKGVRDFLLVRHSNLRPILHRFGDIAGVCANDPASIPPYFGDVPVGTDCRSWGQSEHLP